MQSRPSLLVLFVAILGTAWCLAGIAHAQPTYSIDFQGPTAAPGAGAVSDGDILGPVVPGVVAPPAVIIPAIGGLGLAPLGVGIHGGYEVDALSYGSEPPLQPGQQFAHAWTFSVDEFAFGLPGVPGPSVTTEGAGGAMEASADIFGSLTPPGPLLGTPFGFNTGLFDGNGGATPFLGGPGLNLVEPNPPTFGGSGLPDVGDNLDAWDLDTPPGDFVYFSLDSGFGEPFEPFPANTGTAVAQGFVGGDVLVSGIGFSPAALYADARMLGLSEGVPLGTPNTIDADDLDALVLWENGTGIYEPTMGPYSWMSGSDMLLFSLRRNSALLLAPGGTIDALGSGLAITEGDILIPVFDPIDGVLVQDGMEGDWDVGIFIPAEALGLDTVRSGGGFASGLAFPNPRFGVDIWDDELDALDVQLHQIPEPGCALLMGLGLAVVGFARRRLAC